LIPPITVVTKEGTWILCVAIGAKIEIIHDGSTNALALTLILNLIDLEEEILLSLKIMLVLVSLSDL